MLEKGKENWWKNLVYKEIQGSKDKFITRYKKNPCTNNGDLFIGEKQLIRAITKTNNH